MAIKKSHIKMRTRTISLFLVLVTALGLLPISAFAGSIADGSKTCTVAMQERSYFLTTTYGTRLGGAAYRYTTNDGLSGPAFCLDHGLNLTYRALPITGRYNSNPMTAGAFANGYPQHSLETFMGLYLEHNPVLEGLTEQEYAYATQLAIWGTLGQLSVPGTTFNSGRETVAEPTAGTNQARVFRALQLILIAASTWDRVYQKGMYIRLKEDAMGGDISIPADMTLEFAADKGTYGIRREVIEGVPYYTIEYIFASATSTYHNGYNLNIWADNAPEGCIFTDMDNNRLSTGRFQDRDVWVLPTENKETSLNDNGDEHSGKAKLCIPVDNAPNKGEIKVNCGGSVMQYDIYLAYNEVYYEQSYIIADPSEGILTANVSLNWGSDITEEGRLQILKVNGSGQPLSGAKFELSGSDGSVLKGTTNDEGIIYWEKLKPDVKYTLTETEAPAGYAIVDPVNVKVEAARTTYVTVKNSSEKTLTVKKIDKQSGYSLAGATIVFEKIDGSFTTTRVTDHAGMIQLTAEDLPIGSYKVYERAAPEGYELDKTAQTVDWDGVNDVTLTFTNVRKPTLVIYKCDEANMYSLPGAVFEVYKDGKLVTTVTTNDNGLAYVPGITEGYYTVKEKSPPEGYQKDETEHGIYIDPYNPASEEDPRIVVTNKAKPSLLLQKYDAQTGKPLSGCTFEFFRDSKSIGSHTTNADGQILLQDLEPGTYLVKETDVPDGYTVNPSPQEVEIKAGDGLVKMVFYNSQKPGLKLIKLDSQTMKPLEGAVFRIEQVGGSFADEYTTDKNGEIDLSKLTPGAYKVTEVSAPDTHLADAPSRVIYLEEGKTGNFVFTNTAKPDLKIIKTDADTGKPLEGVTFKLKHADGSTITTLATNAQGEILVEDLTPGVYEIWEQSVPAEYLISQKHEKITLFPGETGVVHFENHRRPSLIINKVDSITGDPIQGAKFKITYGSNSTSDGEINELGTYITDENGQISLDKLKDGWYDITEIETAPGYSIKEPASQQVFIAGGDAVELTFENTPLSALVVWKFDSVTSEAISGAVFQVKLLAGTSGTGGTVIGTYKTSANGSFTVTGLKAGTYIVEELASDSNHVIDAAPQTAYISGKEQAVVQLYFGNSPKSIVLVKKIDAVTGKPLSDVEFLVTTSTGSFVGDANGKFKTDSKGTFLIEGLDPGTTLVIKETQAKEGYILDDTAQTVTVRAGQTVTLEFRNQPKSGVLVKKVDSVTNKPISGVEFLVTTSEGTVVGNANGKYTTDSTGTFLIEGVDPGTTLVIKETRAKEGYILDDTAQTVKVKSGEVVTVEFRNQPKGNLIINKLDSVTKKPLEGVQFELTYSDGRFVDNKSGALSSKGIYVTDKNGQITISQVTGTIVVKEIKTIDGYIIHEETRTQTVIVNPGDTQTLTFYNDPTGGLELIKVNASNKSQRLGGAVFEIHKADGALVDTITTGENGRASIALNEGSYYAVEVEAPGNFKCDSTPHYFTVKDGKTTVLTVKNEPFSGIIIHKKDSVTGRGIYGVSFILYDSTKKPAGQYTSDDRGYVYIDGLTKDGKYFLRELEAAKGYVKDEQYKTVYVKAGETTTVEWENTPITGQILITKYAREYNPVTGGAAGSTLKGAVFEISHYKTGKVIAHITSDARGIAASDPLPLGRYIIREVTAPAYYTLSADKFDVELEYPGQILKLAAYNDPAELGVTINKTGIKEVLAGSNISYKFTVANDSNVPLESFFWRDRIPTDFTRAVCITTGTYSHRLNYRVLYKTNQNDYRVLASNLLTTNNYSFSINAIQLVEGEVVTDIYYDFGTVPAGFQSKINPTMTVFVGASVKDGSQIINRAYVGGKYMGTWETANTSWITIVRQPVPTTPPPTLPQTGY